MIGVGDRLDVGTQEEKELKDDVQVSSLGDREMVVWNTLFPDTGMLPHFYLSFCSNVTL